MLMAAAADDLKPSSASMKASTTRFWKGTLKKPRVGVNNSEILSFYTFMIF